MKIYEIGTGYTPIPARVAAATESVVEELTKAYLNMNKDVEIIDISAENRAENNLPITEVKVPSVFTKSDVSLGIVHKLKRVVYSVALAASLRKILKKEKNRAVLHFHNQYNLFFFTKLVSKKLRSKAVIAYTNHNGMWSLPWNEVKDTLRKRYFQEISAMKNADLIFVLNDATKKNIVTNLSIDENKVILINNGVNTETYRPYDDAEKEKTKEKYSLSGKKIILQVGSVYENKNQIKSLEMLAPLMKNSGNLIYAFAGGIVSDEYFDKIMKTAVNLGISDKVRYLGSVSPGEEMNSLYNIAYATVFSSEYEGFPLVCIESISAGVPVMLCTRTVMDFGEGSIAVSSTQQTDDFINNENYESVCIDARKNAEKNYTWQTVAEKYLNSFNVVK